MIDRLVRQPFRNPFWNGVFWMTAWILGWAILMFSAGWALGQLWW